jgi:hypothetical protein
MHGEVRYREKCLTADPGFFLRPELFSHLDGGPIDICLFWRVLQNHRAGPRPHQER